MDCLSTLDLYQHDFAGCYLLSWDPQTLSVYALAMSSVTWLDYLPGCVQALVEWTEDAS